MQDLDANRSLKLVAIGGGTGLSTLLAGLKRFVGERGDGAWLESLAAIVTVSDDGARGDGASQPFAYIERDQRAWRLDPDALAFDTLEVG